MDKKYAVDTVFVTAIGVLAVLLIAALTYVALTNTDFQTANEEDGIAVLAPDQADTAESTREHTSVRGTATGLESDAFLLIPEYGDDEARPGSLRVTVDDTTAFFRIDTAKVSGPGRVEDSLEQEITRDQLADGDTVVVYPTSPVTNATEEVTAKKIVQLQ
ncbi:MAG: hypothetical protein ABIG66_00090 [Candidatus Kerfeldbacteria bacterium]